MKNPNSRDKILRSSPSNLLVSFHVVFDIALEEFSCLQGLPFCVKYIHIFYRQLDFLFEPGVANEILENEPKICLTGGSKGPSDIYTGKIENAIGQQR